jgi:O-acetyl-ADP-ribose deacetylase (regulator of RNase III)
MNQVLREVSLGPKVLFQIVHGDITQESVDAVVNAANTQLRHGGGVAGVISRKGGPLIQKESTQWVLEHGPVTHETPAYTSGGLLPCCYVIHAVGPIWGSGDEDLKLAAAVRGSLEVAESLDLKSIALPAISTGIYGFPKERAARIIIQAVRDYVKENDQTSLEKIRLTLFDQPTLYIFLDTWDTLPPNP